MLEAHKTGAIDKYRQFTKLRSEYWDNKKLSNYFVQKDLFSFILVQF